MSKKPSQGLPVPSTQLVRDILNRLGDDALREGLKDTPARVVKAWEEWFAGYHVDPTTLLKTFEDGATLTSGEMVLLTDLPVHSHCEHHMAPFVGVAHVAYIPRGRIVGLSKLARVVDAYSRRLQVQERLTTQIADCLFNGLGAAGVGVVVTARHFCMTTRGVKCPGSLTTTSALRGCFEEAATRSEFLTLISHTKASSQER